MITLIEEVARDARLAQKEDDLAGETTDYANDLAVIWRKQGALFVGGLSQYRGRFAEAESPVENVWVNVWDDVAKATEDDLVESLDAATSVALEAGGEAAIAGLGLNLTFDLQSDRVLDYLEKNAALHVKNVNATTKEKLRQIIRDAAGKNLGYNELAKQITDAFAYFGEGATQRHIDSRAHLVAVTELGNAYEESGMIAGRELKDGGIPMEKHWDTIGDSRVSDGCQQNQGADWIELEAEWPATDGTYDRQRPLRFPGCRCSQRIQVNREWRQAAVDRFGVR